MSPVMSVLDALTLQGKRVRLEPLTAEHIPGLQMAASESRANYGFTWVPDGPDETLSYVESALADQATGRSLPWAVRRLADDAIIGSTRFLDLEVFTWPPAWPPGVGRGPEPSEDLPPSVGEIGSTWYAASAQRTGVNTEVKFLQLSHAFDVWRMLRVTLKTDARNINSRRAIERLGARLEGIRRAHVPGSDGSIRDSAYYSIVANEWSAIAHDLRRHIENERR